MTDTLELAKKCGAVVGVKQEPVPSHWDCGCGWHNSLEFAVCTRCSRTPNEGSAVWRYKPFPSTEQLQKRVKELEGVVSDAITEYMKLPRSLGYDITHVEKWKQTLANTQGENK